MVVFWAQRFVSLAVVVTLAGTPALVAACMAMCTPAGAHAPGDAAVSAHQAHGTNHHGTHQGHGGTHDAGGYPEHSNQPASERAQTHHHHDHAPQTASDPREASGTGARLVPADRSCCASDLLTLMAAVTTHRADAGALLAVVPVAADVQRHEKSLCAGAPLPSPPISPPAPMRAPLVLRI